MIFLKAVLSGEKLLLKIKDVQVMPKIPKYAEIDIKKLWGEFKTDDRFKAYVLNIYLRPNYVPDRSFFFVIS